MTSSLADKVPLLHLKYKIGVNWKYGRDLIDVYLDILSKVAICGIILENKNALLTGMSKISIRAEIMKSFLLHSDHHFSLQPYDY